MLSPLAKSVLAQEQFEFALNRAGRGEEAQRALTELIEKLGSSSETYGILGRVYKDRWELAQKARQKTLAGVLFSSNPTGGRLIRESMR